MSLSPSDARSTEILEASLQNWQKTWLLFINMLNCAWLASEHSVLAPLQLWCPMLVPPLKTHLQTRTAASSQWLQKNKKKLKVAKCEISESVGTLLQKEHRNGLMIWITASLPSREAAQWGRSTGKSPSLISFLLVKRRLSALAQTHTGDATLLKVASKVTCVGPCQAQPHVELW